MWSLTALVRASCPSMTQDSRTKKICIRPFCDVECLSRQETVPTRTYLVHHTTAAQRQCCSRGAVACKRRRHQQQQCDEQYANSTTSYFNSSSEGKCGCCAVRTACCVCIQRSLHVPARHSVQRFRTVPWRCFGNYKAARIRLPSELRRLYMHCSR